MAGFVDFFKNEVPADPMKAEYLIPTFIGELLAENKMSVKVLRSNDTWYGIQHWNYFDKACLHGFRRKNMMK